MPISFHKTFYALGTTLELSVGTPGAVSDIDDAYQLIRYYENKFTVNRSKSEIMTINNAAGRHPVRVPSDTYALVKRSVTASCQNTGFNAAIGPLVKLWQIGFSSAKLPDPAAIQTQLPLIDPHAVVFNDQEHSVWLTRPGMELDLGAIAKGWIADRIAELWAERGISSGQINLGGNLLLIGPAPNRTSGHWHVGIQSPEEPRGKAIAAVEIGPCSAVTSGIYERYLQTGGHFYHHILDPQTGYPKQTNLASVTVFTRHSVDGELWSTRLFFAGPGQPLPQNAAELFGAVFVTTDHRIIVRGLAAERVHLLDSQNKLLCRD
ncbi:MAG: FAD:protein FMN transferase [Sporolactobacillus sp.]